jgi:hypothetical protein
MKCPKCERKWPDECQQAECVRRYGECIVCRFLPRGTRNQHGSGSGTQSELDALPKFFGVDMAKPEADRTTDYPQPLQPKPEDTNDEFFKRLTCANRVTANDA